jgi:hypothetical protein
LADVSVALEAEVAARLCDHPACREQGEFRAPKSPQQLDAYFWFCLEHVRAYNTAWNYFSGMSQPEIERFQREAITGHRPTWRMGTGKRSDPLDGVADPLGIFGFGSFGGTAEDFEPERRVDSKQRRALAVLNLEVDTTLQEVKMRYKQLVKRYHPDANGGDKAAEERFKTINEAYNFLLSSGAF